MDKGQHDEAQLELARGRLALDREIFASEVLRKDAELQIKRREEEKAGWRNPLVVAILAASAAAAGNALVAIVNGQLQRDLEDRKAEGARILQMIGTGTDTEQAAANLDFLARTGLIQASQVRESVADYLKTRKLGSGPALPAASTTVVQPTRNQSSLFMWFDVPRGSKLCVKVESEAAVFKGSLMEDTKIIANWQMPELRKKFCEPLVMRPASVYLVEITLAFNRAGDATIEAEILTAEGKTHGNPFLRKSSGRPQSLEAVNFLITPAP